MAKEDVFKGNRNVSQPIFPANVMLNQFSAFKHTLSLMRYFEQHEQLIVNTISRVDSLFVVEILHVASFQEFTVGVAS